MDTANGIAEGSSVRQDMMRHLDVPDCCVQPLVSRDVTQTSMQLQHYDEEAADVTQQTIVAWPSHEHSSSHCDIADSIVGETYHRGAQADSSMIRHLETDQAPSPLDPTSPPSPTLAPPSTPKKASPSLHLLAAPVSPQPQFKPLPPLLLSTHRQHAPSPTPQSKTRRPRRPSKKPTLDLSQPRNIIQMKWHERVASGSAESETQSIMSAALPEREERLVFREGDLIALEHGGGHGIDTLSARNTQNGDARGSRAPQPPRPSFVMF
ncbi:hypothetical protein CAC42_6597 [Sphaceloma murrayae]|uniref:Uncharacterized protein n=1 Tax=Sphaceloma murrayae TaxID=2082308 RepID=A0A2K1QFX4_9PEZI|nr:hypothetical protein CAC42_6597 [Sphaceloma murrayae]